MAWTGVITNAGQALLDAWAGGGHTMTIDRAEVGSGITEAANLLTATQLAHYEAAASIIRVEAVAGGTKFKIQVAPATSEAYNATEIGIYAHIDSEASVLMALHQDPEGGVAVPTRSQSPDFAFALYCIHAISNTSQLTVNIDPNAYVSMSTFNTAITSLENSKLAKTGDAKDATVAYTSADITDSAAAYNTGWTSAGKLTSGEKFSVVLNKISTMMKNLRWIHKLIGDTDISALSTEHTIAGALSKLNTDLSYKSITLTKAHANISDVEYARVSMSGKIGVAAFKFTVSAAITDNTAVLFTGNTNNLNQTYRGLAWSVNLSPADAAVIRVAALPTGNIANFYTAGGIPANQYEGFIVFFTN